MYSPVERVSNERIAKMLSVEDNIRAYNDNGERLCDALLDLRDARQEIAKLKEELEDTKARMLIPVEHATVKQIEERSTLLAWARRAYERARYVESNLILLAGSLSTKGLDGDVGHVGGMAEDVSRVLADAPASVREQP